MSPSRRYLTPLRAEDPPSRTHWPMGRPHRTAILRHGGSGIVRAPIVEQSNECSQIAVGQGCRGGHGILPHKRPDRVGLPDDPSARSGEKSAFRRMVARSVAGRTGSARPLAERAGAKSGEGAVLIPAERCAIGAVKGQRKGRVLYTHPYLLYTHPYLLDRLDRLLPSASTTCSRQRGGPGSSGGSRWPLLTDSRPNSGCERHQLAQLAPHRRAPRRRIMPA